MGWTSKSEALHVTWELIYYYYLKKMNGSGGIRTHASKETGALNQRLRPLGHATVNTSPCYLEYTWLSRHWGKKIKAKEWAIWTMVWFYYYDQNSFFFFTFKFGNPSEV